jgi:hypothetical protein
MKLINVSAYELGKICSKLFREGSLTQEQLKTIGDKPWEVGKVLPYIDYSDAMPIDGQRAAFWTGGVEYQRAASRGALGGVVRSKKKSIAVAKNGALGGRPSKKEKKS